MKSLANIYRHHGGLETVFTRAYQKHQDMFEVLKEWYSVFTSLPAEARVLRHIANVEKGSAAKRVNMFLRWMVRHDGEVDFGLWKEIPTSALLIPLDLHTGNVSRQLGLLTRNQNDRKAVEELTARLREMDPVDPIRYDFSLFGLGAIEKIIFQCKIYYICSEIRGDEKYVCGGSIYEPNQSKGNKSI